jgi:excisionase family DNA binding protein
VLPRRGYPVTVELRSVMTDDSPALQTDPPGVAPAGQADPSGVARLLTISEAASATGLSRKALTRRVERGSLRAVKDERGRRVVPRGELERAELLNPDGSPGKEGSHGGQLVIWRDLYERERQEREEADAHARELEHDLIAIANAGPIRALRLRNQLRAKLAKPRPGDDS